MSKSRHSYMVINLLIDLMIISSLDYKLFFFIVKRNTLEFLKQLKW